MRALPQRRQISAEECTVSLTFLFLWTIGAAMRTTDRENAANNTFSGAYAVFGSACITNVNAPYTKSERR